MSPTTCPACGSANTRLFLDDEDQVLDPSLFGSSRRKITHGRILRCVACEFGFRQLRSNSGEIAELYRRMDVGVYESEMAGRRATAARHLEIVKRFISGGRVLDVGCASGLFLNEARKAGWTIAGVEPSEALFVKARTILGDDAELYCSTLEHATLPPASFDAVALWDVLEHVPDPLGFLQTCCALLKRRGKLFLNVPDIDSLEARLLRKRWPLLLAEHLNYFNRKSLRACADKAGLNWEYFGRRRVSFSVDYILFRLTQHRIPGANLTRKLTPSVFGGMTIPIYLGETFGVWSRP